MTQPIRIIRIATQGPAGPAGLYPQASWNAGSVPYPSATVLAHGGGVWLALRDTSVEPSPSVPDDWAAWIDIDTYASLDETGKILPAQLPAIAITNTFTVASQAAMLLLTAETGDVAIRSDVNRCFVLAADPASVLTNWKELLTPTDAVLSVAGRTGAVTLAQADIAGLTTSDTAALRALALTGQSVTGSAETSVMALSTTWNTTGNPSALDLNVTETGSGSGTAANLLNLRLGGALRFKVDKYGQAYAATCVKIGASSNAGFYGKQATLARNQGGSGLGFHATDTQSVPDIALNSYAAGVWTVTNGAISSPGGGAVELIEQTAPASPSSDRVRLYAQDNGSGKTQIMAKFADGSTVQLAVQP